MNTEVVQVATIRDRSLVAREMAKKWAPSTSHRHRHIYPDHPVHLVFALLAPLLLAACGRGEAADPNASRPPVAVEVAAVRATSIEDAIDVVGTLAARHEAVVTAEYRGIVAEILVDEWIPVRAGQPLARLDMREIEAQAGGARAAVEMAEAQALAVEVEEARARRELARLKNLDPYGIVSRQELDNATSALESAEARRAAARAALTATRQDHIQLATMRQKRVITSPIAGVVSERNINVGDFVADGTPPQGMFRIVDNRFLELTATVASRDAARIAPGQPIVFVSDAAPGETFIAPVKRVNPTIDPRNRSIRVFAEIANESGPLRSGLFITGRLVTGRRENVLVVPRAALLTLDLDAGRGEVLVALGETAERRPVLVGAVAGEVAEIREGLSAGDRVVTVGGHNVREGDRIVITETGR